MKIYTCTDFEGHYPVGTAAVVVAPDREQAAAKLNADLQGLGLPGDAKPEGMIPLIPDSDYPVCRILADGDYYTLMDTPTLKRLLRKASACCPQALAKQIHDALGPQPDETLSREALVECLIEAVDARDIDDALHYSTRILNLDSTP